MAAVMTKALAACAVAVVVASGVAGQQVVQVSGEVSCVECRIVIDTILTLGGLDGPGDHLVDDASRVLVDHRGRILVTTTPSNEIADADHAFVRRDAFWAQSGTATVTESETVVLAGEVPMSESFGHHLHLLHENGDLRSYGWDGRVARGATGRWFAVAANDTTAWIVDERSGRVETWTLRPVPKLSRVVHRSFETFDREAAAGPRRWPGTFNIRLDPATGRTLARHRSDLPLVGFVDGSEMVTAYEETDGGVPRLHLLRALLRGRQ